MHVNLRQPLLHGQPMSPVRRERSDEAAQELLDHEQAAAEDAGGGQPG